MRGKEKRNCQTIMKPQDIIHHNQIGVHFLIGKYFCAITIMFLNQCLLARKSTCEFSEHSGIRTLPLKAIRGPAISFGIPIYLLEHMKSGDSQCTAQNANFYQLLQPTISTGCKLIIKFHQNQQALEDKSIKTQTICAFDKQFRQ